MNKTATIIGDPQLPSKYIYDAMRKLEIYGLRFICNDWSIEMSLEDFTKIVLEIERGFINKYKLPKEIIDNILVSDILVVHYAPVSKEVLEKCDKLKIICCIRGGIENVDVEFAKSKQIKLLRAQGRNVAAVADFTIGLILALTRQIIDYHILTKNGQWKAPPPEELPHELNALVLGIIGFGQIGKEVAKRAKVFGMKILAYDPHIPPEEFNRHGVVMSDLENLLKNSDVISIHARLTPDTRHLIGEKELRKMKNTAYLINTARGEIIDEEALVRALKEKWISGAALDVFTEEPLSPNHPLLKLENVILTPHIAGFTWEGQIINGPEIIATQLENILKQE